MSSAKWLPFCSCSNGSTSFFLNFYFLCKKCGAYTRFIAHPGDCCNIMFSKRTSLTLKYRKISFVYIIHFNCQIVSKFGIEHISIIAVQNVETILLLRNTIRANEISWDLSWRLCSDGKISDVATVTLFVIVSNPYDKHNPSCIIDIGVVYLTFQINT